MKLRVHPYIFLLATIAMLTILGALVFSQQEITSPNASSTIAWGGFGGGFSYPVSGIRNPAENTQEETPNLYQRVQDSLPFSYQSDTSTTGDKDTQSNFDLDAFLSELAGKKESMETGAETSNSLLLNPYAFIPSGFTLPKNPVQERTAIQQALYEYGNEAGTYVQSFENANKNMVDVVQGQIDSPQDPLKAAALVRLAKNLTEVGLSLENMADVPAQAISINNQLAKSYKDMGAKLALVPDAHTDEERIAAMLTYNVSAEEFVRKYVALVKLFSVSEVTFALGEPGSVFTFAPAASF